MKPNRAIDATQFEPLLKAGFTLIPLHRWDATRSNKSGRNLPVGKTPVDANWTTRDYDSRRIATRAAKTGANVGVRLSPDWIVVEYDPRRDFDQEWTRFCVLFDFDPDLYPCVQSGGGGLHCYARKPSNVKVVDTLKQFDSIEFKSSGRQMVAPGSRHPNGMPYRWLPNTMALEDAPGLTSKLLEAVRRPEIDLMVTGGGEHKPEDIDKMLSGLKPEDFRDESCWRELMMACHHASGGEARQEFIDWSWSDPKYTGDETVGRRWDSLHSDRAGAITVATLYKALSQAGRGDLIPRPTAADDFAGAPPNETEPQRDFNCDETQSDFEGGTAKMGGTLLPVEQRGLVVNERTHVAPDTITNAYAAVVRSELAPAWDELRQNTVFRTEALPWDESYGRVVNDHVLRLARLYFVNRWQGVSYQPGIDNLLQAIVTIAYAHKFNPVLEYLDSLHWDGVPRLEKLFGAYFNCGEDDYTRAVSRCFMVGAVRRIRRPGCKFDTMPILKGAQGWNKSTGVKVLFSEEFWSDASLGNLRDKDAALKLRGIWVQEFAEVDSLTRAETNTLKHFCSLQVDRQRDPYGRVTENSPRRCVFIATVNEGGYLKDPTGARRFWPLEVSEPVNIADLQRDRDQLWAEAVKLESDGAADVLPYALWAEAGERAAEQTTEDPCADAIRLFLEARVEAFKNWKPNDGGELRLPPDRVHTSELYDALSIKTEHQTKDKAQRLRTVMEATLGWRHVKATRIAGRNAAGYVKA